MHTTVGSRKQKGLTLVEIMVAIVISLILTAGIIQLFLGTTQTYRFQEALSRIQENGRYAMEVLARDIRMAGYWGCASADLTGVNSILNGANNYAWNFSIPVEGFEADGTGWTPTIDPSIVSPLQGSDIITLRSLDNAGATIAFQPALPAATIHVVPGHQLAIGQVVIATDCVNATAFQITNINNVSGGHNVVHSSAAFTPGNATNSLGYQFTGGEILAVSTKTYYVREGGNGVPALWRSVAAQPAQELVEGVERMRITYGIDNNNNNRVDEYVGVADIPNLATGGPDWDRVVSVRVELLLVSMTDNITGGVQPIEFAGETITPTDNRLRQVFTTTIGVRNRLP